MSNKLSSVYHGKESRQRASALRPHFIIGGAAAAFLLSWWIWQEVSELALVYAVVGAFLGMIVGSAKRLLSRLMIAGAVVGLTYVFLVAVGYHAAPPVFTWLAAAAAGAGAGTLLTGLITLVRKVAGLP